MNPNTALQDMACMRRRPQENSKWNVRMERRHPPPVLRGRYWADMSDVTQLLIPAPASSGPARQQLTCLVTRPKPPSPKILSPCSYRHCHPPPCSLVLLSPSSQGPIILATPVILSGDAHSAPSLDLHRLNSVSLSLPPESPITPQPIRSPFRSPYTSSAASPRLLQGSPTSAPETPSPQRAPRQGQRGPTREGAGPRPRSLFMNGGAGGARPYYYAARRAALQRDAPIGWQAADVTEPVAGGGAGRGDSRRFSRGRGGFSGSAHILHRPDPSGTSPRPSRAQSREVSSRPSRGHQASESARRVLGRWAGGLAGVGGRDPESRFWASRLAPSVRMLRAVSWVSRCG
ncbi:hypothetical protein HPG69_004437 [Diceros bicornis minor]|uniref:Uncharacterized protein n=1 Tax=Diceros bicornis minor TaxID=77932 RepID=A0A7J7F949_DICBM|nr:hypothetical protein HPG69_004437 [Diceros bicornis minor]